MVEDAVSKEIKVTLVVGKSRVFPINEKASGLHGSMPRKELSGGMLAVDLIKQVRGAYTKVEYDIFVWTDSVR